VLLPTVPGELGVTGGFRELRKEPVSIANGEGVEDVIGALEPYPTYTTLKGVDDVLEPPGPMSEPIALTAFLMLLPIDPLGFRAEVMAFPMLLPTVPGELEVPGASLGGHIPGGHIPAG
jgi:hypothetical protein